MISIIIPVFNAEYSIKRAFDSLLNQTIGFENLEVILIDDKSTDDSARILQDYNNKYENVKAIFLDKNSGSAGTPRNMGLIYSTKEYVLFLDSDDILYEDACEILYREITKENCDIVSGVHTTDGINTYSGLWIKTLTDPETDFKSRKEKVNQMVDENFSLKINSIDEYESIIVNFGLASKIFRKTFLINNNITFPEKIVGEDSVFLFNAFLNASGIKFINKFIYRYYKERQSGGNASLSYIYSKKRLMERLTAYLKMLNLSIEKDKSHIFKKHLLLDKLNYFTQLHLLKSDLSTSDLMDVLEYGTPLFKSYMDYNPNFNGKFSKLFNNIANKNYEDALRYIFNSNIPNQKNIKIATILDPFSKNSFQYEFDSIDLTPDSWKEQFESEKPVLFFCESAYHGISNENKPNGVWQKKIYNSLDDDLNDILTYCNQNNIPAIFWNKEDPISFVDKNSFTDTALKFDYIFTSCEETIEEYHLRGHEKVYPLMFAAQPMLFNPIKQDRLNDTVVFAGTWYSKFPKRCKTMERIFDKILNKNFKLKIYDRFFSSSHKGMRFPKKYSEYINPNIEYPEMPKVYKESEFGLNFNTITDSNTMFARRVFELMASNTTVLSNYSKGVYRLFKDNVLYLDRDEFDLNRNFSKMKEENLYNVLENHTYSNRFRQILDTINFKYIPDLKHIVLFYRMDDLRMLNDIQNHFYSINYPYKHLKLITDDNNSFLSNTIMEDDLKSVELKDNYYFSFANLDLNPDFIKKALLHFQYIDKNVGIMENAENKYVFNKSNNSDNVVFNESVFNDVIGGNELDIYYI